MQALFPAVDARTIVLNLDLATYDTFSRGRLRLAGTVLGLLGSVRTVPRLRDDRRHRHRTAVTGDICRSAFTRSRNRRASGIRPRLGVRARGSRSTQIHSSL